MSEDRQSTATRRDVLKKGVIATGGLVVGGTAMSGTVVAKGGTGFVTHGPTDFFEEGVITAFRVTPGTYRETIPLTVRPSCNETERGASGVSRRWRDWG